MEWVCLWIVLAVGAIYSAYRVGQTSADWDKYEEGFSDGYNWRKSPYGDSGKPRADVRLDMSKWKGDGGYVKGEKTE